jgi:hypothetical protein
MQEKKIQIWQSLVGHKMDYILPPSDKNMPEMIAYEVMMKLQRHLDHLLVHTYIHTYKLMMFRRVSK